MTTTLTHPVAQGLLAAILDEPGDDGLRLIFADWLEDHGEPERAEFIRSQCRLAAHPVALWRDAPTVAYMDGGSFLAMPAEVPRGLRVHDHLLTRYGSKRPNVVVGIYLGGDGEVDRIEYGPTVDFLPAYCELADRATDVDVCRNCDWHAPLTHSGCEWEFHRGFVHAVRCPLETWEQHGPALVARHPVERVDVTGDGHSVFESARGEWRLTGFLPVWFTGMLVARWVFSTKADARTALSRELLAWSRAEARKRGLWPGDG